MKTSARPLTPCVKLDVYNNSYLSLNEFCKTYRCSLPAIERNIIKPFMFEFVQLGGLVIDEKGSLKLNADQSILMLSLMFIRKEVKDTGRISDVAFDICDAFLKLDSVAPDRHLLYLYAKVAVKRAKKLKIIKDNEHLKTSTPFMGGVYQENIDKAKRALAKLDTERKELEGKLFF